MALTPFPVSFARLIVAAPGTSEGPVGADGVTPVPVPDNCTEIWVTNPDGANSGVVGFATPGGTLTPGIGGQRVRPASTIIMAVGAQRKRGSMDEAAVAGSGLAGDAIGGAITLEVTYISVIGGENPL